MAETLPACEAFTAKSSLSRCSKPSKGLITTENPKVGNRTINWHVCSNACATSLADDLRAIELNVVEVSV